MDGHDVYVLIALRASGLLLQNKTAHTVILGPGDEAALRASRAIPDASDTLRVTALTNIDKHTRGLGESFPSHDPVPMTLRIQSGGKDGDPQVLAD